MKKLILALVLLLTFALPVLASDDYSGTVTVGAEYNSDGDLIDTADFSITSELNETTKVVVILETTEMLFGTPDVDVIGKLCFDWGEGETAEVKAKVDVLTGDLQFDGKYIGLPIGDDMTLSAKGRYKYPSDNYYTVGTLVYDFNEDTTVIVEARLDSDGGELFSAEAQVRYAITEDIDIKVGAELNDWADDIDDWDDMEIADGTDCVYVEVIFRF